MRCRLLLLAILLLAASCRTVRLETIPAEATVITEDGQTMTTPCDLTLRPFAKCSLQLSKDGYESRSLTLDYASFPMQPVTLSRLVTITSTPVGAQVTCGEHELGQTPFVTPLENLPQPLQLRFSLPGYLPAEGTITPAFTETGTLHATLTPDGPGRTFITIQFTRAGYPHFTTVINEQPSLADTPTDQARLICRFDDAQFPYSLRSHDQNNQLLLSLICRAPQGRRPRYTAHLEQLDLTSGQRTALTPGDNLELFGDVWQNTLFYVSLKTGRFDIWRCPCLQENARQTLFCTNNLVKIHLDATPANGELLFTGLQPTDLNTPKLWLVSANNASAHAIRSLCDGEHATWSPQAQHVVFQKNADNTAAATAPSSQLFTPKRIWRIESDGSQLTPLNHLPGPHVDKDPCWSPDGQTIAFASNRHNPDPHDFDLWLMDADGSHPRKLTSSPSRDDCPVFTHDGRSLLFRSNRGLHWGIWQLDLP